MNKKVVTQVLIVLGILVVGIVIFKVLASMRKDPVKKPQVVSSPLLNARKIKAQDVQVVVDGFGTVWPKVEVQIIPQVSGRVVALHENMVDGGFFEAGEALISIERSDYELAVETAKALVKQAEVLYQRELAEQKVALEEWAIIHPDDDPDSPLLTRELQVKHAMAELKSAEAKLKGAELDLGRTVITVPFDGRVQMEEVDLGQYLTAGKSIAEVYATGSVEIVIPLADTQLGWFDVPLGYDNGSGEVDTEGSEVEIKADFAGQKYCWAGQVVRTQGRIDAISRMVKVVVEVENPFRVAGNKPPLIPGMFVEADIQGKELQNVFLVPRYAVHNEDEVWLEEEGKLKITGVEIIRRDKMYAYVTDGLKDDDVIVVSPLDVVTDGMDIRVHVLGKTKN